MTRRLAVPAACAGLALLTFFQFPGHTWLQQDTQIWVPILEHLRDPSVLRNDILTRQTHVAFTLYDEIALFLRALTGLSFEHILEFEQLLTRALGIWGLLLCGQAMKLPARSAWLAAGICSLGAMILGPQVLTFEYEATPRAFAVPLLLCAIGLAARGRYTGASVAGAAALLYHPPTALPFWAIYLPWIVFRRRFRALIPLLAGMAILLLAAWRQAGSGWPILSRLTPFQEQLERLRGAYVWISTWGGPTMLHWFLVCAIALAAYLRIRRAIPPELRVFLLGLPALALLLMPVSWLLLEHWKWALVPQVQPLRTLLFAALAMQFLTAAAGARAQRWAEATLWFFLAYLLPLQARLTGPWSARAALVALGLALLTALAMRPAAIGRSKRPGKPATGTEIPRGGVLCSQRVSGAEFRSQSPLFRLDEFCHGLLAPAAVLAAFFAIPLLGGVVNYPHLHTPELAQLSAWARTATPQDAVFLFPDAGRGLDAGIFRSQALRAVYVDWKGGGQVNYLKDFGEQWWPRWQQTMVPGFKPADIPSYRARGIGYIVLKPRDALPETAVFSNGRYVVYALR